MIQLCVTLTLLSASLDNMPDLEIVKSKYSRQVLVNSILGFGCTLGMGIFYTKGNDAYEDYKNSESMSTAVEAWDRVKINDAARNVCAVGAVFFFARALYYQVKRMSISKSKAFSPVFDIHCAYGPKMTIGLQKDL